jgi:polyisoprenoid-binding protein YceI
MRLVSRLTTPCLLSFGLFAGLVAAYGQTTVELQFDKSQSWFVARANKSGLFSFAAHNHGILATEWNAAVRANLAKLSEASVRITIPAKALVIDSQGALQRADLKSAPSPEDIREVQQKMLSPQVLDAEKNPLIEFSSTAVELSGSDRLTLRGPLTLHGQTREVAIPVRYRRDGDRLRFAGAFTIKQTDFGLKPESIAGGTVKVKNEVEIRFELVTAPVAGAGI